MTWKSWKLQDQNIKLYLKNETQNDNHSFA
jgi:hypothetical protein